jgi:hypothetical protein
VGCVKSRAEMWLERHLLVYGFLMWATGLAAGLVVCLVG